MNTISRRRRLAAILASLACVGSLVGLTGPAQADEKDLEFCPVLGIWVPAALCLPTTTVPPTTVPPTTAPSAVSTTIVQNNQLEQIELTAQ